MYKEKSPPTQSVVILVSIFCLLTLPLAWLPELGYHEALTAMMTRDLYHGGTFFLPTIMGQPTIHPPLPSWILAVISFFVPTGELTVRLVGILSLAGLAGLAAHMVYPVGKAQAAGVAAASVVSSVIALHMGIMGTGDMLFAALICASWFTFYHLSREHKQWLYAWFCSHLLVCLAMLAGGPKAIFYFYLPLFFMRRPIHVLRRMRQRDHMISLLFLVCALIAWLVMVPNVSQNVVRFFRDFEPQQATAGYLLRFLRFPFRAILAFMPWPFLAWPAFCLAFRPLEKDATLAQFCRTVVWAVFFCFWLLPDGKISSLLPLIGPLGVLTGLSYHLLARRHGKTLLMLPRLLAWATIVGAVLASGYAAIFMDGVVEGIGVGTAYFTVFLLMTAVGLAIFILRRPRFGPIWLVTLLAIAVLHLVWVSSHNVRQRLYASEHRFAGQGLSQAIPPEIRVYALLPGDDRQPRLFFYVDRHVVRVQQVEEVPREPEVVYLVTAEVRPISAVREWVTAGEPVQVEGREFRLWRGTLRQ